MDAAITTDATNTLAQAIREFLLFNDYGKTYRAFESELACKERTPASAVSQLLTGQARATSIASMLERYDSGASEEFFALWRRFVPVSSQEDDEWAQKIEFGLQVYFATWPLLRDAQLDTPVDCASSMTKFKAYLDTRGAFLASNSMLFCYYALPYIEPQLLKTHRSFAQLFTDVYIARQRLGLQTFLETVPGDTSVPRLYSMLNAETIVLHRGENVPPEARVGVSQTDLSRLLDRSQELDALLPTMPPAQLRNGGQQQLESEKQGSQAGSAASQKRLSVDNLCSPDIAAASKSGSKAEPDWEAADERFQDATTRLAALDAPDALGHVPGSADGEHRSSSFEASPAARSDSPTDLDGVSAELDPSAAGSVAGKSGSLAVALPQSEATSPGGDLDCPLPTKAISPDNKPLLTGAAASSASSGALSTDPAASKASMAKGAADREVQWRQDGWEEGGGGERVAGSVTRSVVEQALLPALDWTAVQCALASQQPCDAARLLQATRWRLIKSPPGAYRRQVLASITDADVLRCSHSSEMCIVSALLAAQHSAATSELVRLLSAMASDSAGRSYLMQPGSRVVPELFQLLKTTPQARVRRLTGDETRDTPLHQHTLALMQKLSLGRAAQSELISLGMPHWLVTFLERPDSLSELCLEYSMALLMNLCLRSAGRTAAETLPVLDALDAFIQVPNMQVRTYVHGTLYSLLCRPAIREQAHQSGLADSLRAVSATSEPVFQRHIAHILERLEDEDAREQLSEDEGEEEDDVDGMEYDDEYDEMEEVLSSGGLVGERLLGSQFLARRRSGSAAPPPPLDSPGDTPSNSAPPSPEQRPTSLNGADGSRRLADKPLQRPATPTRSINRAQRATRVAAVHQSAAGSLAAQAEPMRQGSGTTMRERAQRAAELAAQKVKPAEVGASQEYVSAFGSRKELPRTPQRGR